MVEPEFTPEACEALQIAAREAERWGDPSVSPEHLLLALLDGKGTGASRLLTGFRFDVCPVIERLERYLSWAGCEAQSEIRKAHALKAGLQVEHLLPRAARVMDLAHAEAQRHGREQVGTEHLLYGIAREGGSLGSWLLLRSGLAPETLSARLAVLAPEEREALPSPAPSPAMLQAINAVTGVAILGLLWSLLGLHFLLAIRGGGTEPEDWPGLLRSLWAAAVALASVRGGMLVERSAWPRMMALLFVSSAGATTLVAAILTGMAPHRSPALFFFLVYLLPLLGITIGLFRARAEFGVDQREGWRVLWREGRLYLVVGVVLELLVLSSVIGGG